MKKLILLVSLSVILTAGMASATYHTGDKVADFTLTDSNGDTVSLYDYYGKVVFINFWGLG